MPDNENNNPVETDVPDEDLKDLEELDGATDADVEAVEEAEEAEEDKESAGDEDSVKDSEEPGEKKGFFSRKKDKKFAEYEEKIGQLTDRYQRLMAEFDNYRKRTDKEKASMRDNGVISTIEKLLPVVDSLERGLASVPDAEKDGSVYKGMDQIYKQTVKVLQDMGVEPIEAEGKEFDLNLHNAVLQVPCEEEGKSGFVSRELQKGYTYKGTVVRHSMVAVFE